MKQCNKCGILKLLSEFRKDKQGRGKNSKVYYRPECKKCEAKLRKQLKQAKLEATPKPNKCECCGAIADLIVDHDHVTGKFRGWICRKCNQGIGKLGDDIEGVKKAMEYLCRD